MKEITKEYFFKFLLWREKHIQENVFLGILSLIIGIFCAIAAATLKYAIHYIQHSVTELSTWDGIGFGFLIFPLAGVLLSGMFVKYIIKDDIGHGVTKILYAISQRKSRIKPHNIWSSMVASTLTIGFGGSVGAESPIVLTGSAIGSNIGRLFRMEQKNLMLLVGCGAAGAISAIFKAPITGLIFAIEVLLLDLTLTSVMPLLISAVTGATVSYIFMGKEAMFTYVHTNDFELNHMPWVILLGIVCGLISLYFTKITFSLETWFKKLKHYAYKYIIAAMVLSILIFIMPPLYGEGYITIHDIINLKGGALLNNTLFEPFADKPWILPLFILMTILAKVFATVATNSGGGCGGVFAPTLFIGSLVGALFAMLCSKLPFNPNLQIPNFALMGMAGVMAGVMSAPLTGTFLIAELTGGYDLFLPLLVVSMSTFATIKIFLPHSIYSLRLAEKGKLLTHQKDKAVLTLMEVHNVIETDFSTVSPKMTLGDVVKVFSTCKRNVFPVVDDEGIMRGIVLLDNIRNIMFRPELYNRFIVETFMVSPAAKIVSDMTMDTVMKIFDDTHAWNLPVIDPEGHYMGFVSKSQIFNTYRDILINNFNGD